MGKQKRARNLKVIGEGSYGCVHRPSLKCKTPPTRRFNYGNYISKTLKTRDAQNELEEYNKLQEIDPKNQYHLGKPILCHPAPTKETIQSLNKCRDIEVVDIKNDAKNYSLLISKYGGEDVHKFFKNSLATFLSKNRQKKVDHILMSIYNLLNGIQTFRDNDLVHYDIKPQNILFNKKTFEMKYIDFGLMNNKTTIIQDSNDSENWLGIYHWSYPFECGLMNKNKFYEYANLSLDEKQMYKSTFIDSILSKRRSHLIKHPDSFELLFAYIDPLYEVPNNEIQYTYMKSFFEGMDAIIHTNSYEEILNKITDSIDLFGLGVSIQLMINFLKSQDALDERIYMDISSLCKKMYHFNLQERVTDVQLLLDEYSTILVKHDVYKRLKKKQQRHRSIPVKQGKHVSAKLSNKAYLDPYEWNTNKTRRPPKMHKNKSRRRIQI